MKKIAYSLSALALGLTASTSFAGTTAQTVDYPDFFSNSAKTRGAEFIQTIKVLTPAHCSYIKGKVAVVFEAPEMTSVDVVCWRQPTDESPSEWGHDALLFKSNVKGDERLEFTFNADEFPNGPMNLRFRGENTEGKKDYFELQLFNLGGVVWNQGAPKSDPPGAKGMKLVFEDDFNEMPAISPNGIGARYAAHKTGGGDFSGWRFSDQDGENNPFGHEGTFLRIHASKGYGTKGRTGILSSLRSDGTGICVPVPSYFECRFLGHSAPGSWPAFWTLTKGTVGMDKNDPAYAETVKMGSDELDIIEAYGGFGPKHPNAFGKYSIHTHFWKQTNLPQWTQKKLADGKVNPDYKPTFFRTDMIALGGQSAWSWTFHTYAVAVTETDTIYYCDDIEVGRHPTGPTSLAQPAWFLINYAIAGISGWPIDMERYGNQSDMWIDYVRVYSGSAQMPEIKVDGFVCKNSPAHVTVSTPTPGATIRYTLDGTDPTEKSAVYTGTLSVAKPATFKASVFADNLKSSPAAKTYIIAAPGVDGSVGINFVSDPVSQTLNSTDIAGIGDEAQGNWNAVDATSKTASGFTTSDGVKSPITLTLADAGKTGKAEPWGFAGNILKMRSGNVINTPRMTLANIPYAKYDVMVIFGASGSATQGTAALSKAGDQTAVQSFSVNYTWLSGKSVISTSKIGETPSKSNYVVFTDVTEKDIDLTFKKTSGGWFGIAAIQIIPKQ